MQTFIMMVGLPGSGKSTYAAHYVNADIHSSDAIREELFGDATCQDDPNLVFGEMQRRTIESLKDGRSVIYDATNLNAKKRASLVEYLRRQFPAVNYECVVCVAKLSECKYRNITRERQVPEATIDAMLRRFQPPYYNEGWDGIVIARQGRLYRLEKELHDLLVTDHDNHHHIGTIGDHCLRVSNHLFAILNRGDEDLWRARTVLGTAGIYHDIGKRKTKVFHDDHGNPTEEAHYYGHACVGSYMWLASEEACEMGVRDALQIAALIAWHMVPLNRVSKCDNEEDKAAMTKELRDYTFRWGIKRHFSRSFLNHLWLLHEADMANL